jgi:hypothetical protein
MPGSFPDWANFKNVLSAIGNVNLMTHAPFEQCAFKNENKYLNVSIYSYLETSGGQSSNLYLHAIHFFNTSVK